MQKITMDMVYDALLELYSTFGEDFSFYEGDDPETSSVNTWKLKLFVDRLNFYLEKENPPSIEVENV